MLGPQVHCRAVWRQSGFKPAQRALLANIYGATGRSSPLPGDIQAVGGTRAPAMVKSGELENHCYPLNCLRNPRKPGEKGKYDDQIRRCFTAVRFGPATG